MKKNKILSFAGKWVVLDIIMLNEINLRKTDIYDFPDMWNIKQQQQRWHESKEESLTGQEEGNES